MFRVKKSESGKIMIAAGSVIFLFSGDRFLKYWALKHWGNREVEIVKNFFQLELFKNYNIAFGLPAPQNLIIVFNIFILAGLVYYFLILNYRQGRVLLKISLLLIIVGGVSNLYDRLNYGFVADYINIFYFPVFNLADVMISLGAALILVLILKPFKIHETKIRNNL